MNAFKMLRTVSLRIAVLITVTANKPSWMVLLGGMIVGLWSFPVTVKAQTFGQAQTFIVDQSNAELPPGLFQNIEVFSPIGQEFTPIFSSLNLVELITLAYPREQSGQIDLFVNIRKDTITGSLLGTSSITTLPTTTFGAGEPTVTRFNFASPVALVPNKIFVIELITPGASTLVGSGTTNYSQGTFSTYAGGNQILTGQPVTFNDLWFREGLVVSDSEPCTSVPEPSLMAGVLMAISCLALAKVKGKQKFASITKSIK
jgi:hypothetical protein